MPKYLVKFPEEALWIAWLGSLTGLVTAFMVHFGVDKEIVLAVAAFIPITGRLITGMLLPTPTRTQEIAEVKASTNPTGTEPKK